MSPRTALTCCLLAAAAPAAAGFAPTAPRATPASSALPMASTSVHHASEESYPRLLADASVCAHSDTCSIESAEMYLKEIVHAQSGCAAGTLSGHGVCDDVLSVSAVVADLRMKIGDGTRREVGTFWDKRQAELEVLAASSDGSATAALTAPLKPAYLAFAALYAVAMVSMVQPPVLDPSAGGIVPFTAQEIWWAVRDGYVGDLASHAFHNGGLLVGDAMTNTGSALSPQELFWSVRDGYAADTLFSSGLEGGTESVPFTPQEVWWAVKNGYSYDMVAHWFRNGGLSV